MDNLLRDLHYCFRLLARNPAFTLVSVLTLALGIGANTAIFSIVNTVVFRPLPYRDPDTLYVVWGHHKQIGRETASLPDFTDWREQNQVFENLVALSLRSVALTGRGEPERLIAGRVSTGFLSVIGLEPLYGRDFLPEEDRPDAGRVALLSYGLWQRRFGGDPAVVGQVVSLNGEPHTVVGITPRGLALPPQAELWIPLAMDPAQSHRRSDFLQVLGRLKPGVTPDRALSEMKGIASRLEAQYPDTNRDWSVELVSLEDQLIGSVRPALLLLWGAVALVLLIACVNVAHLLLARSATRRREVSIRAALGADSRRLVRQLLTEAVTLACLGALGGLLLAQWAIGFLVATGPAGIPRLADAGIDAKALAFTLVVAVATGILFGLAPAWWGSRADLVPSLQSGGRGASGAAARFRSLLVVVEVALSLMLLVGAGLLVRSFGRLTDVAPGFRPENLFTVRVSLPAAKYGTPEANRAFFETLLAKIAALPGARSVAAVDLLYVGGGSNYRSFSIEGEPPPPLDQVVDADLRVVTPSFHSTIGIPLLRGRAFVERETVPVVVVNETFARRYFDGRDPLGRRVAFDGNDSGPLWREIVGVVGDVKQDGLDSKPYPEIEVPYRQRSPASLTLVVRTDGDPLQLAGPVRAEVRALDPDQPVYSAQSMEQVLAKSLDERRFTMLLLAAFSGAALALAAVGIYGLVSFSVTERFREIGVRMALGAGASDIRRLVVGQGMGLVLGGVGVGLLGALVFARQLQSLLFEVSAVDTFTLVVVPTILCAVALLACYVPARRATRVDPVVVLRYD